MTSTWPRTDPSCGHAPGIGATELSAQPVRARSRLHARDARVSQRARPSTRELNWPGSGVPCTCSSRPPRCPSSVAAIVATARCRISPTCALSRPASRTSATGPAADRWAASARCPASPASGPRPTSDSQPYGEAAGHARARARLPGQRAARQQRLGQHLPRSRPLRPRSRRATVTTAHRRRDTRDHAGETAPPFIIIGENIHCSRVVKREGARGGISPDGRPGIHFPGPTARRSGSTCPSRSSSPPNTRSASASSTSWRQCAWDSPADPRRRRRLDYVAWMAQRQIDGGAALPRPQCGRDRPRGRGRLDGHGLAGQGRRSGLDGAPLDRLVRRAPCWRPGSTLSTRPGLAVP